MLDAKSYRNPVYCLVVIALSVLVGCQRAPIRDPAFASVRPALPPQQQYANGAIYQFGTDTRLFEDLRARRIGDILTVRLVENTNASKSAETISDKESTATIANPTIFGTTPQFDVPGFLPLANTRNLGLNTSLSASREFDGSGETSQENSLTGSITVTVVEVYPNGNLVVRGEKRLTLNNGNEYIRVSGIIRPIDIQSDNSIVSTKIADATIIYTGDGVVAESNRAGWLTRFFNSPVFPF